MRAALLLLVLASACRCSEPAPIVWRPGLVAAVESDDGIRVLRSLDGATWTDERLLPGNARALRFSPDGSHVAWVVDETRGDAVVPVGWVWRATGEAPASLGVLGLRTREAMGLAVAPDGRVAYLTEEGALTVTDGPDLGQGWGVLFDLRGGLAFVSKGRGCSEARDLTLNGEACGDALELLDLHDDVLLARTNRGLVRVDPEKGRTELAVGDVSAGALGPGRRAVIIRKVDARGVVMEEVATIRDGEARGHLQRPLVVSAAWDDDGTLLVVERLRRQDLYELLLAHSPAEFGGEALAGDAVRLNPERNEATPVPGLEGQAVRTLFRARVPAGTP